MLARAVSLALVGLEPRRVDVEAHVRDASPGFAIVGLADSACSACAGLLWLLFERIQ